MTNAEWCLKNGYSFYDLDCNSVEEEGEYDIFAGDTCIDTIKTDDSPLGAMLKWLDAEHVEPILNDADRQYLSAVIRPFRDRVWYIMKSFSVDKASCYIFIRFNDGCSDMEFPVFRKSDMYKGMKICKAYTLEELGL